MSTDAEDDRPLQDSEATGATCRREIPETPSGTQDCSDYDLSPAEASKSTNYSTQGEGADGSDSQSLTRSQPSLSSFGQAEVENRQNQSYAEGVLRSTERFEHYMDDDEMLFAPVPQWPTREELIDKEDLLRSEDIVKSSPSDNDRQEIVLSPADDYDSTVRLEMNDTHDQSLHQISTTRKTDELHTSPGIQTTSVSDAQQIPNKGVTAPTLATDNASKHGLPDNTHKAVAADQTLPNSSAFGKVPDKEIEADPDQRQSAMHKSHESSTSRAHESLVDVLPCTSDQVTAASSIERIEDDPTSKESHNAVTDTVPVEPRRELGGIDRHDLGAATNCTEREVERSDIKAEGQYSPGSNDAFRATPNVDETQATEGLTTSSSTQQSTNLTPVQSRRMAQQSMIDSLVIERDELLRALASLPGLAEHTSPGVDASTMDEDTAMAAATSVTRRHIKLLHEYNEIRDVGMGLMGLIADARGVRIKEVQEEFGIETKD